MPPRIFVQIPAYRDTELAATLCDIYVKARHPSALRTVVLWQKDERDELPDAVRALPGLTIIETNAANSRGPNWARNVLQRELGDEPYTLLLDSHHRFVRGWDEQALGMLHGLEASGVRKPVLSSYLPRYVPGRGKTLRQTDPFAVSPMEREEGVLTRLTSYPIHRWSELAEPVRASYVSLHFLLAPRAFTEEVAIDPEIYFFGDEVTLSVRAFTHGWDVFHPHRVLGWHAYSRSTREPHWERHPDWHVAHRASLARQRSLYTGGADTASLRGDERSVAQFEEWALHRLVAPT